jgi:hypothetical protein
MPSKVIRIAGEIGPDGIDVNPIEGIIPVHADIALNSGRVDPRRVGHAHADPHEVARRDLDQAACESAGVEVVVQDIAIAENRRDGVQFPELHAQPIARVIRADGRRRGAAGPLRYFGGLRRGLLAGISARRGLWLDQAEAFRIRSRI